MALILAISCGGKNKKNIIDGKNEQKIEQQDRNQGNEENEQKEGLYGKGIDEEFTTDGKLHENKFLNKDFGYPNSDDYFKIEKDNEGYFITDYIDDSFGEGKEVPIKEEKTRLKLENGIYLVKENGMAYAYDTKLNKLVLLNKGNDFRIMFIADETE